MTKTERRKQTRLLRELAERLDHSGNLKANNAVAAEARKGHWMHDDAFAILWALGYVERHVNLATGELTIPLEDEESAA